MRSLERVWGASGMELTTEIPRTDNPPQGEQTGENKGQGLYFRQEPLRRKKRASRKETEKWIGRQEGEPSSGGRGGVTVEGGGELRRRKVLL